MDLERKVNTDILITTSRNPTHFLRRTAKILKLCLPNTVMISRGSLNINQVLNYSFNNEIKVLLILHQTQENGTIKVNPYFITRDTLKITSTILISNIITLKAHDSKIRLTSAPIRLKFSQEINNNIKEKIIFLFEPIIEPRVNKNEKFHNMFYFQRDNKDIIEGMMIQSNQTVSYPILQFRIICD
ncbi:MAG: hypothetical protein EAX86_00855 [Candidatus Heimdallarchaeota archaeon]|nr:hypothetical protein [Candidatus Heimdallarchaeota archaeon]